MLIIRRSHMNTATRLASASCLNGGLPTIVLLALCVLPSFAQAAASSDTVPVTRSAVVSLAGLDLSTPEGARIARGRLLRTARHLCSLVADHLDLSNQSNFAACVDESL